MNIIPAIIPKSKAHLLASLDKLGNTIPEIQIDLVDGVYAGNGNPSWPWSQGIFIDEMYTVFADIAERFSIEMDLMVERPELYVEELVSANVARLIIHAGSTDKFEEILTFRSHVSIGLAFKNDTPLDLLRDYHDKIDFVQCMGIAEIGVQGNPFDERVLTRVKEIRDAYPTLEISVDGGVTKDTIAALREAGVTRFVSGSAILGTPDPLRAYTELKTLATS